MTAKSKTRQLAMKEVARLMAEYTKYLASIKDKVFTREIREQLRTRSEKIRWLQKGLENGFYDE